MQTIDKSLNNLIESQSSSLIYIIVTLASVFIFLIMLLIGQVYLAFASLITIFLLMIFFHSPIIGIMILLVASASTGFFNRIALNLTGIPAPVDFIRFGIEILLVFFGIRLLLTRPIKSKKSANYVDISVWAYLIFSTIYTINLFYVGPQITLWGWRWTCPR